MPPTRREFVAALAGAAVAWRYPWSDDVRIDAQRLQETREALSVYGRPNGGTFADGVSRIAYSEADVAGRSYVMGLMQAAGLSPRIDTAGNINGRREGKDSTLKPILLGSHIDSVPSGGNFDGDVGSLAAIDVVQTYSDHRIQTRHPLEVSIWSNEEGGVIGSRAAAGELPAGIMDRTFNGIAFREGLRAIGGDPDRVDTA